MSHAEYAPKRLPVLKRLAMALRQIPAVEFALAKFKTLLSGRTNAEQAVTSEFLPPPSDVAKDEGVAKEPSGSETAQAAALESETPVARPVGSETIGIDSGETIPVNAEPAAADLAEIASGEPDIVAADDATTELSEEQVESVEVDIVVDDGATGTVVIDAGDMVPVAVGSIVEAGESILEADDVAFVAATSDDLPDAAASDMLVADAMVSDTIEPEAVETPRIAAEAAEIDTEDSCTAEIDTVEATATDAVDIVTPAIAASDDRDEQEAEPVATVDEVAAPVTQPDTVGEREALIRRRWKETGIMMWRGVGQSTLCIQGSTALLPPKPGETMPQYDRLEFRLIDGLIVCEGFVVEPPAPLRNRPIARAA